MLIRKYIYQKHTEDIQIKYENMKIMNYLDFTFNLDDDIYKP